MNKKDFLTIFNIKDEYGFEKKKIPYLYSLADNINFSKNTIFFYFFENEISLFMMSKDFSENSSIKELSVSFNIIDGDLFLLEKGFKNEIFPHLNFKESLEEDLLFISNIINQILIPKYQLKSEYKEIDC